MPRRNPKDTRRRQDDVNVIEALHYQQEVDRLKLDPILIGMFNEMRPDIDAGRLTRMQMNEWDFICRADDEYRERGGTLAKSIGGVARALRTLAGS